MARYIEWAGLIIFIAILCLLMCGYIEFTSNNSPCTSSKGEEITRYHLADLYKKPFIKIKPSWIVNPETGKRLELDCYNEELGLAVEYNGEQHYKFPNTFHKTKEEFDAQIRRDLYKKKCCADRGVLLIEIPYTLPKKNIREFLKEKLNIIDS